MGAARAGRNGIEQAPHQRAAGEHDAGRAADIGGQRCVLLRPRLAQFQHVAQYGDAAGGGLQAQHIQRGSAGEGIPATEAQLFGPLAVAISLDGTVYIADTNNHRIRKIDHGGNIVTVAGTGVAGFAGDGGPAAAAQLDLPAGLALDAQGRLFIADTGNNRVRMVTQLGVISTVAGDGSPEELRGPSAVAVDGAGALFIADRGNHRIRRLPRPD